MKFLITFVSFLSILSPSLSSAQTKAPTQFPMSVFFIVSKCAPGMVCSDISGTIRSQTVTLTLSGCSHYSNGGSYCLAQWTPTDVKVAGYDFGGMIQVDEVTDPSGNATYDVKTSVMDGTSFPEAESLLTGNSMKDAVMAVAGGYADSKDANIYYYVRVIAAPVGYVPNLPW